MNATQQAIEQREFLNRRAIDRQTVEELGRIDRLWLDPQSHRVVGFTCKSGFWGQQKRWLSWEQVDTIGENILVNVSSEAGDRTQPAGVVAVVGCEVLTDTGNKAGSIVDYLLDVTTGAVISYLFKSSGWRGVLDGIYVLSPTAIANMGSKRAIVAESALQEPQKYAEGLNQRMVKAKATIEQDLKSTLEDAEVLKRNAQRLAEEAQKKAQAVKGIAQDRAQVVKQRAQAVKDLAQERIDRLRHRRSEAEPPTVVESVEDTTDPPLPKDSE